jgi:hypothetical protein
MKRIAGRFAESGRPDDNPESFVIRLNAYNTQTAPLLPYYQGQGKLVEVDGMGSVDDVAAGIDKAWAERSGVPRRARRQHALPRRVEFAQRHRGADPHTRCAPIIRALRCRGWLEAGRRMPSPGTQPK